MDADNKEGREQSIGIGRKSKIKKSLEQKSWRREGTANKTWEWERQQEIAGSTIAERKSWMRKEAERKSIEEEKEAERKDREEKEVEKKARGEKEDERNSQERIRGWKKKDLEEKKSRRKARNFIV